jgi:hypothetical protein
VPIAIETSWGEIVNSFVRGGNLRREKDFF